MPYNTEQKRRLLVFLKSHPDTAYTIEEIASNIPVGKSTVYRLMSELAANGTVKRFSKDASRRFVYQLIGCDMCTEHLHMKCTGCGKILHMNKSATETVLRDILADNNFSVDSEQTVIFGKCALCSREAQTDTK